MTAETIEAMPYGVPYGATAHRPDWSSLPADLREFVQARLGQPVVGAVTQGGGFTSGFASRLLLGDGSRVFVKAVSSSQSPDVFAFYDQEARVAAALPARVPAPTLRWAAKYGQWLVLVFDDVAGRIPERPWRADELAAVLDMLPLLAAGLTPAPPGLPNLGTTADVDHNFSFWRRLAAGECGADPLPVAASWVGQLGVLAALESDWAALAAGQTGAHFDLRDDNILLADDGRVLVCDWNWLTLAAPWVDLVGLLISVHGDGHDAQALLAAHPLAVGVSPRAVDAFLAAVAGNWAEEAAKASAPADYSPWMRTYQAWRRDAALSWLALRLRLRSLPVPAVAE